MQHTEIVTIEKLVFGGQALAHLADGRIAFVWNALPGETVNIELLKNKKSYVTARAIEVMRPSPDRQTPIEKHFLSCSPWSILSFDKENEWKQTIAEETFQDIARIQLPDIDIVADPDNAYHYRNKIEYSFCQQEDQPVSFSFFERGQHRKICIPDCQLASKPINQTAHTILEWIRETNIPIRSLKSLIVRSNQAGETIAALFIKDKLSFENFPKITSPFSGFQLYYSSHKCPASRPDKLLYNYGQNYLIETILNTNLKFGLLSFFQVNPPLFSQTLQDVIPYLDQKTDILDFYSGVGAIGLPLHDQVRDILLVDNNAEAIHYAKYNIAQNAITSAHARCIEAEHLTDAIHADNVLILDPPRAGLHPDVTKKILQEKPIRIIYISCNLTTQARDIAPLLDHYQIQQYRLYNYFPRTPHIEGMMVLDRST